MNEREIRGLAILSKGDTPLMVNENEWIIPSQSGNGKYKVQNANLWSCECPDFKYRKTECKHIHSIKFYLKMKNKAELDDFNIEEEFNANKQECPHCYSDLIVKYGKRKTSAGIKQRWQCRACKKLFVLEPLKRVKANPKIITLTMDLYFKGLSLRDISDTVYQFYNIRIHFDTIRRWINKFTAKMDEYTKKFTPELSGQIHTDEQLVKSKGKWVYAWNSIDHKTRFVLASTITEGRKIKDAQEHFIEVKENNPKAEEPKFIITDSLGSYPKAIKREFRTKSKRTKHISIVGRRHLINNNLVERYHNEFREFDKVRRGFKSNKTTQEWANGHRLYHNFIKRNSTIGMTPSEKAGIDLKLERNKWLSLLEKSLNQ
ncbi:MAG: IS6 family transposase [archaeon]